MNQTEVTKNALLKGLCKDCKYYAGNVCTRVADKFLEKHLDDNVFERENEVGYEDMLEYAWPHSSCKFWEKIPEVI